MKKHGGEEKKKNLLGVDQSLYTDMQNLFQLLLALTTIFTFIMLLWFCLKEIRMHFMNKSCFSVSSIDWSTVHL